MNLICTELMSERWRSRGHAGRSEVHLVAFAASLVTSWLPLASSTEALVRVTLLLPPTDVAPAPAFVYINVCCAMKTDPVFNLTFVGLVEKHSCLYDFNNGDYNNRSAQERAWETIANEVNESVTDCKERWKNIRGCYTRYLKSVSGSGSGGKAKQPYYLAEPLSFLLQFTKCRKSIEYLNSYEPSVSLEESAVYRDDDCSTGSSQEVFNLFEPENNMEIKEEHEFMTPPAHKKVKLMKEAPIHQHISEPPAKEAYHYFQFKKELHAEKKTEDSDLAFLTSLLTDMKEMSSNQKRRFKIGILNLAGQILNEPVHSGSSSAQVFTPSSSCPSSPALSVNQQQQP